MLWHSQVEFMIPHVVVTIQKTVPFKCLHCNAEFKEQVEVMQHLSVHSIVQPKNHCKMCGRTFNTDNDFEMHRCVNTPSERFKCKVCGEQMRCANALKAHMETHQEERRYQCLLCEKKFKFKYNCSIHMLTHSGEKPHRCSICDRSFSLKKNLKRHLDSHSGDKKFYCSICDKKFIQSTDYQVHLRTHVTQKKCLSKTKTKRDRLKLYNAKVRKGKMEQITNICNDIQVKKQADSQQYECLQCHKTFNRKFNCQVHYLTHSNEKPFQCPDCDCRFTRKRNLDRHRKVHQESQLWHCSICRVKLQLSDYSDHMQSHASQLSEETPCNICSQKFPTLDILQRHKIVCRRKNKNCHAKSDANMLKCTICNTSFISQKSLRQHMKTLHKNPIACRICNEICYKNNYKIHMWKHKGRKIHQCELCSKEFTASDSYKKHNATHSNERKYECELCGKRSVQLSTHKVHMLKHAQQLQTQEQTIREIAQQTEKFDDYTKCESYLCEHCAEAFSSEEKLLHHVASNHGLPHERHGSSQESKMIVQSDIRCRIPLNNNWVNEAPLDVNQHIFNDYGSCGANKEDPSITFLKLNAINSSNDRSLKPIDTEISMDSKNTATIAQPPGEIGDNFIEQQFLCAACCKNFADPDQYAEHMKVHSNKNRLKIATNVGNVVTALPQQDENPVPCEFCQKPLMKHNFELHMITHSGKYPFHCKVCGKRFSAANSYSNHMLIHDINRQFHCGICNIRFTKKAYLTKHMKIHTNKQHKCHMCKHTFYEAVLYQKHMLKMHSIERPFVCDKCDKEFSENAECEAHKTDCFGKVISESCGQRYDCAHCEKTFHDSESIVEHMHQHNETKQFHCQQCGKKFNDEKKYEQHQRVHVGDRPFECEICKKRYLDRTTYRRHVRSHTNNKPFACNQCSKSFRHKNVYKSHLLIHAGQNPFQCTICSKRFSLATSLARHERSHKGEKNYRCTVCHKDFLQSGHLSQHMKTHSKLVEEECTICDRKFSFLSNYTRHMRTVHAKTTPFLCEMCGKVFMKESDRQQHTELYHKYDVGNEKDNS